ncbi:MAG: LPS export ABC transporter permease LptG [Tahibacter sp.]
MVLFKKVDKLVALAVLSAVLIVWTLLVGLDAFKALVGEVSDIGKGDYQIGSALIYILLTIPRRSYEWFGNAALIGALLGLGTLAASGELTALRAAGLSKLRICGSVVLSLALLTMAVAVVGETIGPAGDQKGQAIALQAKANGITLARDFGVWARDGDAVIHARQGTMQQTAQGREVQLSDVRVFEFTPQGQLSSISVAKRAEHSHGAWLMHDVRTSVFSGGEAHSTTDATRRWQSGLDPRMLALSIIHPEYLPLRDLHRNIVYRQRNQQDAQVFQMAYWGRLFWPLNVLMLVLCALPFAFGTLRTGGLGKRLFIGIVIAVTWYFLQRAVVNLAAVYGMDLMLANLLPAVAMAVVALVYFRRAS